VEELENEDVEDEEEESVGGRGREEGEGCVICE